LVCVRYRYDETTKERWKTVELIIERSPWEPPPLQWSDDTVVALHVAAPERAVRQQVKTAGGKWNPKEMVWELRYEQVVALGLTARIVTKAANGGKDSHLHTDGIEGAAGEAPSTYR
jgi:hypothetical protein